MGEFHLSGEGAAAALSTVVTHDLDTLAPGKCRYGFLCNDAGGVIDDLIVYCLGTDSYMDQSRTIVLWAAAILLPAAFYFSMR